MSTKAETKDIVLPHGRMINGNLFEKDAYVDPRTEKEGTPSYKIEVAFPKDDTLNDFFCDLEDEAKDEWGEKAPALDLDGGDLISGVLDGDKLAARREEKGKQGDAYKGMWVIRAHTIFNLYGQNAPGGIQVWDEECKAIAAVNQDRIYPGCMVSVAVRVNRYINSKGDKALGFYLSAVQRVGDGERLVAARDTSNLFKPLAPAANANAAAPAGRRSRKG